jgi:DNA-binding MarR family transcriptional regulator
MGELDPLIHAPARLQMLSTLSAVSEAEFATLRAALDVSDSVLSKHISTLADAGYVRSRKGVRAGRRTTWIGLTNDGRQALRRHVAAPRKVIDMVE